MNILRELRKVKSKSVRIKLKLAIIFLLLLIIATYAWWHIPQVYMNGLQGKVESWEVAYIYDGEEYEDELTIGFDEFYPGVGEDTKVIEIHNLGGADTNVKVEIVRITLFGEEIDLEELQENDGIVYSSENNIAKIFDNKDYPFEMSYILGKNELKGVKNGLETHDTQTELTVYSNWVFEKGDDVLDTSFGTRAYEYYEKIESQREETGEDVEEKALEVVIRLTARRV